MITILEATGPAVWRASWQATLLAVLVLLIVRGFGERLAPRWRFVLWGVVIARLLFIATPASPWSIFNLLPATASTARPVEPIVAARNNANEAVTMPPATFVESERQPIQLPVIANRHASRDRTADRAEVAESAVPIQHHTTPRFKSLSFAKLLSLIWLGGCLFLGLKLAASAIRLRRQLAACLPLRDAAVLRQLSDACRRIGLKRCPAFLVTPQAISPCIVGCRRPSIIMPETLITRSSSARLGHVLAHELAHLVRGDLWTNWLLLAARTLHWFNPAVGWIVREMQADREAACDDLALSVLADTERTDYATTILDLAANLVQPSLVPGMIGLFSSGRWLEKRIQRLAGTTAVTTLPVLISAGLLLAIGLSGLTDAMPIIAEKQSDETKGDQVDNRSATPGTMTLRGRCLDHEDSSPMPEVTVRVFRIAGRAKPIVEVAKTVSDAGGRFEFPDLEPPRADDEAHRLLYILFADAPGRPFGAGGTWTLTESDRLYREIRILRRSRLLSGTVRNTRGQPLKGAQVGYWVFDGRIVPGYLSATTDSEGRFKIERIALESRVTISHPDYPLTTSQIVDDAATMNFTLPDGCEVMGEVRDGITGQPAAGAAATATRLDVYEQAAAETDAEGRFRIILPEGRYTVQVAAKDRVCVAQVDQECLAGEKVRLPVFSLIEGGLIAGQAINTATGKPVSVTENGEPVAVGLYGPSAPSGKVISPVRMALTDENGRFRLRAAPGENFPYLVNTRGERMAWETTKQVPVIVKEGETTMYDMLITPPIPPESRLKQARELVDSLSDAPTVRTEEILAEFRDLNHTVDETEFWCLLMKELVAIGPAAVPQLSDELDQTTENRMLRRLGFALRAIGDRRAVPALIRSIPRTLLPSSSDYGLLVGDGELTQFMQQHDLNPAKGGTYFDLGRPEREICGALHKLTGQHLNDAELFGIGLSEDPRRQYFQRRMFIRQAKRWEEWWAANWEQQLGDEDYKLVGVDVDDNDAPPTAKSPGSDSRLGDGMQQAILSPAAQIGQHATHFVDLDTGYRPKWPAELPQDEGRGDPQKLAKWATEQGVDLMCVTHREPNGTETFILKSFGLKAWQVSPREVRNFEQLLAAGELPKGKDVGELLMHYDAATKKCVPDANGAFLYQTRDGNWGLIEITDRVTRTENFVGGFGRPEPGTGFFKGVRFDLKSIIP